MFGVPTRHGFCLRAALRVGCAIFVVGTALAMRAAPQPESNRRMAELLRRLVSAMDPMKNPFRCTEQVEILRRHIAQTTDVAEQLKLRTQLVSQLLAAGWPQDALKENELLNQFVAANGLQLPERDTRQRQMTTAICYLRIGEQQNCLDQHNAESCLFPIRGAGVHTLQTGSRGAIGVLTEILQKSPGDLSARWLLNIAYMTIGEYPTKVPEEWRIDPKTFDSEYPLKWFPDVAPNLGLDRDELAGGVVLDDFDNDGLLDLMVSTWSMTGQLRVWRNNGDGTFGDQTEPAGLEGIVSGLNMIQCDYNNDGFTDVLVLRGAWLHTEGHLPLSLLRNNGDFTFTDVTEEAGLLHLQPTQAAVWFDYDGDGWIDLFVAPESDPRDLSPCLLFHNNRDGTFTECAAQNRINYVGFFKGATSADFNNDGRPDLLISNRNGKKYLLRNDGPAADGTWKFTDVADAAGIAEPECSFPCWFFDYDNDGNPDIVLSGYAIQNVGDVAADYLHLPHTAERMHLYHNNGDGTFDDVSREMGVNRVIHSMGCNFGDLDNDGWLDFYCGTGDPDFATLIPSRMFRNDGGKRFQDVTTAGGFGQLQKGHGIAFGDINNDGDQDVFSVVGGAFEADHAHRQLFANPGSGNHWLKLKLEGVQTNRAAIGARVRVVVHTGDAERTIHRTVGSGASFGANPLRQEIGLGDATAIVRVEIDWPASGIRQVLRALDLDRTYHVREGDDRAVETPLKRFAWPRPNTSTAIATTVSLAKP
jgi:hypothetical protein